MSETVVQVDFGRERNESARRLARLLNLVAEHEEAIRSDPVKFFNAARDEIERLRSELRRLHDAMFPPPSFSSLAAEAPPTAYKPLDCVRVTREDYDRMKSCESIVLEWRAAEGI